VEEKFKAKRLRDKALSIVEDANRQAPLERHITNLDALTVIERSLTETKGAPYEQRKFQALRDLSDFITLSQKNKTSFYFPKNTDLLTIGHPRSTAKHEYSLEDYLSAKATWVTAEFGIAEEAKPLIASAIINPCDSVEYKYAITRLTNLPQGLVSQEALLAAIGDGNSTLARRARAAKQLRDLKGRFAWMGGAVKAFFRMLNGDVKSFTGRYVADSPTRGFIQIEAPDESIYEIPSTSSEFIKALINPTADGFSPNNAKYSSSDPIVDLSSANKVEAPNGWTRVDPNNPLEFTDGAFNAVVSRDVNGKRSLSVSTVDGTSVGDFDNWFEIQNELRGREVDLAGLARNEDGSEFDDVENRWANYPENAYQLSRYVGYLPQGIPDGVEGATDNPRELASKFNKSDLVGALEEALTPIENVPANGRGLLGFEGGLQDVKAEAIYQALRMQGEDADGEVARIYDELLGTTENQDALRTERGEEAQDVSEVVTRPDLEEEVRDTTKVVAETPELPELIRGLTAEELEQFRSTGDYSPYLPQNEEIEMPQGYYTPNPQSIDPRSTDFINIKTSEDAAPLDRVFRSELPVGYTDEPIELAKRPTEDLEVSFRDGIEPGATPGYGRMRFLDDEGSERFANVSVEALRDALQLQGVDTNELLRKIKSEGEEGQKEKVPESEATDILDQEDVDTQTPTRPTEEEISRLRERAIPAFQEMRYGEDVINAVRDGASYEELKKLINKVPSPFDGYNSRWHYNYNDYDSRMWVDLPRATQREQWADFEKALDYVSAIRPADVSEDPGLIESSRRIPNREKETALEDNAQEKEIRDKISQVTDELIKQVDSLEESTLNADQDAVNTDPTIAALQEKINQLNQINNDLRAQLDAVTNPVGEQTNAEELAKLWKNLFTQPDPLRDEFILNSGDAQDYQLSVNDAIANAQNPRNELPTSDNSVPERSEAPFILNATPEDLQPGDIITKDHFVITEVTKTTASNVRDTYAPRDRANRPWLFKDTYIVRGYYPGHQEQIYPEKLTARRQVRVYRNADIPERGENQAIDRPIPEDYLDGRRDPDYISDYRAWRREVLTAKRKFNAPSNANEFVWVEDVNLKNSFWYRFVMHYNRFPPLEQKMLNLARRLQQIGEPNVLDSDLTPNFIEPKIKVISVDNSENKPKETSSTQKINEDPKETISTPENTGSVEIELPNNQESMDEFARAYWEEMMQGVGSSEPMPEDFPETLRKTLQIPEFINFTPQTGARLVYEGIVGEEGRYVWKNPDGSSVPYDPNDPRQAGKLEIGRIFKSDTITDQPAPTLPMGPTPIEDLPRDPDGNIIIPPPPPGSTPSTPPTDTPPIEPTPIEDLPPLVDGVPTRTPTPTENQPLILDDGEIASRITDIIPTPRENRSNTDSTPIQSDGYRERVRSLFDRDVRPAGGDPYRIWQEENFVYGDGVNQIALGDRVNHWGQEDGDLRGLGEGVVIGIEGIQNIDDRFRQAYAYVWYGNAPQFDRNGRPILDADGNQRRGTIKKHAVRMLLLNRRDAGLERVFTRADNPLGFDDRAWARYSRLGRVRTFNPPAARPLPQGLRPGQRIGGDTTTPSTQRRVAPTAPARAPEPEITSTLPSGSEPIAQRFINRPLESRTPAGGIQQYDGSIKNAKEENFNYVDPNRLQVDGKDVSQEDYISKGWSAERAAKLAHAAQSRPSLKRLADLVTEYTDASNNDEKVRIKIQIEKDLNRVFGSGTATFGREDYSIQISSVNIGSSEIGFSVNIYDKDGSQVGESRRSIRVKGGSTYISEGYLAFNNNRSKGSGFGEAWKAYYDAWAMANGVDYSSTMAAGSAGGRGYVGAYVWTGFGYGWASVQTGYNMLSSMKSKVESIRRKENKTLDDQIVIRDFDFMVKKAADALDVSVDEVFKGAGSRASNTVSESLLQNFPTPRDLALIGLNPLNNSATKWFGKQFMVENSWNGRKRYKPDNVSLLQQEAEAYEYKRRRDSAEKANATIKYDLGLSDWFSEEQNYSNDLKPYFDEIATLFNKRGDSVPVSLLSPPARRNLQNELINLLKENSVPDSRDSIIGAIDALNRDRVFFENPPKEDSVTDLFRNISSEDLTELVRNIPMENQEVPLVINGEDTGLKIKPVGAYFNGQFVNNNANPIVKIRDPKTGRSYYLKNQSSDNRNPSAGARAELIANQIGKDLEIVGLPLVTKVGGEDSGWILSTDAGGNLNVKPLELGGTPAEVDTSAFSLEPMQWTEEFDPSNVQNIESVNLLNIAVLDTLVDNADRHARNSMMVENPQEGASKQAQRWQPIPIDNADNTFRFNFDVVNTAPEGVKNYLIRSFSDYIDYMSALGEDLGPVTLKAMVDKRLQVLKNNLRERAGGGYLNQEQLDLLNSRISDFEALNVEDYENIIQQRRSGR
jgi:hypothetical protein